MDENNVLYKNQGMHVIVSIFTILDGKFKVFLSKRKNEPYKNMWHLQGGAVYNNESLDEAVRRELKEKNNLSNIDCQFFKVFSRPNRSPVMRMFAAGYIAVVDASQMKIIKENSKISDADWFDIDKIPRLAYDHEEILDEAITYFKSKIFNCTILKSLLPSDVTLPYLQQTFESILNKKLDRGNFRKKILSLGVLVDTGKTEIIGQSRPVKLYQIKFNDSTHIIDL